MVDFLLAGIVAFSREGEDINQKAKNPFFVLDLSCIIIIIGMTGYTFYSIMKMPETIPIHLTDGEIDGWGISYRSTSEREDNIKKPLLTNKAAFFKRVLFCMRHWCVSHFPHKKCTTHPYSGVTPPLPSFNVLGFFALAI